MVDIFHLDRFLEAQMSVYPQVLRELRAGAKQTHWMWFVFPQLRGLGSSSMAQRYAIASVEEAQAYLAHNILGPRLRECTAVLNALQDRSVSDILGYPDDMKFHSSMTLFAQASGDAADEFHSALQRFFHGEYDKGTLRLLSID